MAVILEYEFYISISMIKIYKLIKLKILYVLLLQEGWGGGGGE